MAGVLQEFGVGLALGRGGGELGALERVLDLHLPHAVHALLVVPRRVGLHRRQPRRALLRRELRPRGRAAARRRPSAIAARPVRRPHGRAAGAVGRRRKRQARRPGGARRVLAAPLLLVFLLHALLELAQLLHLERVRHNLLDGVLLALLNGEHRVLANLGEHVPVILRLVLGLQRPLHRLLLRARAAKKGRVKETASGEGLRRYLPTCAVRRTSVVRWSRRRLPSRYSSCSCDDEALWPEYIQSTRSARFLWRRRARRAGEGRAG